MLVKNIKALRKVAISTGIDAKNLVKDEVGLVRFKNQQQFEGLLSLGNFIEHVGPPPAEVKGPPVSVASVTTVTPSVPLSTVEVGGSSVVEGSPTENSLVQETLSEEDGVALKCEKCHTIMVLTTDEHRKGKSFWFCPNCGYEVEVGGQPEAAVEEKKKRVYSKCPTCGKRKPKDAEFCKACVGAKSESQEPGSE